MPGLTMTQSMEGKLSGLERLHLKAKQDRSLQFDNLLHHVTPLLLTQAYKHLNRKSARGVDHESWADFGNKLTQPLTLATVSATAGIAYLAAKTQWGETPNWHNGS